MENGLNIEIRENVFASAEDLFQRLESEIVYLPEEQCRVRTKNQSYPIPRKIAVFGDPGLTYTFSGLTLISQTWSPLLLEIRNIIGSLTGVDFNFVLINRYADGNSCIGQHKDDEADLDTNFPICSLSFGETRTMVFKRPDFADQKIELKPNSLLVMNPPTNQLWSHGIPRQKKRPGVRINLTFFKIKSATPSNKRELTDKPEGSSKKIKTNETKDGVFKENEIPKDMFPIGDSIYVFPRAFRGHVSVHIRRFKKYGNTFYPTAEGVTLHPSWIEGIMRRHKFPVNTQDLNNMLIYPTEEFSIDSSDGERSTFSRFKKTLNGEVETKSITLSSSHWVEMMKQYNDIAETVLYAVYGSMNFVDTYLSFEERLIDENLPDSLDVSLGTQYLLQLLRDSLKDCLKDNGGLKDPYMIAEELIAHRPEDIDSAAFLVDVRQIAESFYYRIWDYNNCLALSKPAMYITRTFLEEVRLQDILRDVKQILCPPNTTEFYEDFSI